VAHGGQPHPPGAPVLDDSTLGRRSPRQRIGWRSPRRRSSAGSGDLKLAQARHIDFQQTVAGRHDRDRQPEATAPPTRPAAAIPPSPHTQAAAHERRQGRSLSSARPRRAHDRVGAQPFVGRRRPWASVRPRTGPHRDAGVAGTATAMGSAGAQRVSRSLTANCAGVRIGRSLLRTSRS
jgi:hypothetical protein